VFTQVVPIPNVHFNIDVYDVQYAQSVTNYITYKE